MKLNKTKRPIFTPCFFSVESGAARTGRELGHFAPAAIRRVIHNIYSSGLVVPRMGKGIAINRAADEATNRI